MNMKIQHSIVIGVALVIGFVLHAAVREIPQAMKIQRASEMQVRMMEMTPRQIDVGGTNLLYLPRISYRDLSIDVNYEFYKFQDDQLIRVSLSNGSRR